ncbi:hypothetical protein B7R87_30765 [Streptomyces tsukubensis]|uniref:Uncharacterized protein n=1 Tax=Streptomyces tsukubensis (strain DSM 42081 / NBRC 108919 / NRRL 18488 / 9993) TaxID=1114943 RepID=A0A7G3U8H0_STRT9|nr:hypothetical protein B7R87_30765 [Streptomyces tsukubensis]QKM66288.1 hypothetical protein STSU_003010 [Streptomyces tsukubensis NRRL18488]
MTTASTIRDLHGRRHREHARPARALPGTRGTDHDRPEAAAARGTRGPERVRRCVARLTGPAVCRPGHGDRPRGPGPGPDSADGPHPGWDRLTAGHNPSGHRG